MTCPPFGVIHKWRHGKEKNQGGVHSKNNRKIITKKSHNYPLQEWRGLKPQKNTMISFSDHPHYPVMKNHHNLIPLRKFYVQSISLTFRCFQVMKNFRGEETLKEFFLFISKALSWIMAY